MKICDTTAVNSGRLNEVAVKLKNTMISKCFTGAQYVLDYQNQTFTMKPTLNYKFFEDVVKNYDNLKKNHRPETDMKIVDNPGRRNDFKYLFHLCRAFRSFEKNNMYPKI